MRAPSCLIAALLLLLAAGPALAQQEVTLQKSTNGQDADVPPGPVILAGAPVTWTYVVANTGSRDLADVVVSDDQGVTVTCPATTVAAGESMTCTGNGTAVEGQYANVGTVTAMLPDESQVAASDPSHYFGQAQAAIDLEKATNGADADLPPGPFVGVGSAVTWTYTVTNVGGEQLLDVVVSDDQGVTVTCPQTALAPGASMVCTAGGTAQPGQYANIGSVTASLPDQSTTGDSDPSHYFGHTLLLEKATNGDPADDPPGPLLGFGDPVTWTYTVTNPGPATVTGLAVSDDQGVAVTCPQTTLAPGESVDCSGTGTAGSGQYRNVGTATATLPGGATVSATDPSHYLGPPLQLAKLTNGVEADTPPGPSVLVGEPVTWTYVVTNLGPDAFDPVSVSDDQGVTVTCPATTLAGGASMTCTASGVAAAGQYANVGTATATSTGEGGTLVFTATARSHYFGQVPIDYGDAPDPSYPTRLATEGARHLLGSGVFLGACVDSDPDGQPTAAADGDDVAGGATTSGTCATAGDDEDGVTVVGALVRGTTGEVAVVASAPCTLSAWIDFDGDGDWADAGEELFPGGTALAAGTSVRSFGVPAGAATGSTAARFRCTTAGPVSFVGEAPDGEVEDHVVAIVAPEPIPSTGALGLLALAVALATLAARRLLAG